MLKNFFFRFRRFFDPILIFSGLTYIIDRDLNVAQFQFPERICAFTAGSYALTPGHNEPCLVYVNFNDEIFLYYNLEKTSIAPFSFEQVMRSMCDEYELQVPSNLWGIESKL
jgi:hypothetical protein